MPEKRPLDSLQELFPALRIAVLEKTAPRRFQIIAKAPAWLGQLAPSAQLHSEIQPADWFPFLENFLLDAETFWTEGRDGVFQSGPWLELPDSDTELNLEATALSLGNRKILLIQELGESFQERRDLLQKARENSLIHQRLFKEIQLKEVLLHCIVHDLAGPLTGVKGLFTLLARENLSEAGKRRLKIGEDAASKLEDQVRGILEVFSAEVEGLQAFTVDPGKAPDLRACMRSVVDTLQAVATLKNIDLKLEAGADSEADLKVAGENTRLERILFNLLENAFRHSPPGGTVMLAAAREGRQVRITVTDDGPGIQPEAVGSLFEKFHQGTQHSGKIGLGLYFCRIVVERWGGEIGYTPRPEGGSCFWFTLPAVVQAAKRAQR